MRTRFCAVLLSALALAASLPLQAKMRPEISAINRQLGSLADLPDDSRGAVTYDLAQKIYDLPGDPDKVRLASKLSSLTTRGDLPHKTLQAVTTTLARALTQSPLPPARNGAPAVPYIQLASLVRYEDVTLELTQPEMLRANAMLAAKDAAIQKADFTLRDLHGNKVTLSALRGHIVLVNFWTTTCPLCRQEMSDLDVVAQYFQSQGVVVLSINDGEDELRIANFLRLSTYHPAILLDPGGRVAEQFHVDGIPRSFVFDRDGQLVAQAIDMRSRRQLLAMLMKAGAQP